MSVSGNARISTPEGGAHRVASAVTSRRRTPSLANILAVAGSRPFGIEHDARRLRSGNPPHGELRIVGEGGADTNDDGVDQRP